MLSSRFWKALSFRAYRSRSVVVVVEGSVGRVVPQIAVHERVVEQSVVFFVLPVKEISLR